MKKTFWDHSCKPSVFVEIEDGVETYRGPFRATNIDKYAEMKKEIDELKSELTKITEAAVAVLDRWELPVWKDAEPTAKVIYRLRDALGRTAK